MKSPTGIIGRAQPIVVPMIHKTDPSAGAVLPAQAHQLTIGQDEVA